MCCMASVQCTYNYVLCLRDQSYDFLNMYFDPTHLPSYSPHSEHGVSRSVTVVLAYQMWAERRSLKTLYCELKDRRPEIRSQIILLCMRFTLFHVLSIITYSSSL